jgi:pimeloyl-ACP methyl ester carboxylesterase
LHCAEFSLSSSRCFGHLHTDPTDESIVTTANTRTGQHAGLFFRLIEPQDTSPRTHEPPLVLLPGLLSDGRQLLRLAKRLPRRLCIVDPLGSGQSEVPTAESDYQLGAQSDRLDTLLSALGFPTVDLAGFSMGGMWAQHALTRHPQRFRRVGLISTTAAIDPRLRSIVLGLRAQHQAGVSRLDLFRTLQVMFFSADFLEHPSIIPMLEALWGDQQHTPAATTGQLTALLTHDLREQLPRTHCVTTVIAGGEDFLMPPKSQQRLATLCKLDAPVLIQGAGHALWVERPDELASALFHALPPDR